MEMALARLALVSCAMLFLAAAAPLRADDARRALIVVGLGNNDSECGDYRLEPNGPFLAGLRDAVRTMAGTQLLAPDFDTTFAAAGYYSMRHPAADGVDIVVVNDVLWSTDYRDRCG